MSSPQEGAEIVVSRRIKPGKEKEYSDWLRRVIESANKFPGYRGVTTLAPQGFDSDIRYLIWRFDNEKNLGNWETSEVRKKFIEEVSSYAEQHYEKASGMETWFSLPDMHRVVAPPKWKMLLVTLIAAYLVSLVSHVLLSPFISLWSIFLSVFVYAMILVATLTYFAMPRLSHLLRKWLYGKQPPVR